MEFPIPCGRALPAIPSGGGPLPSQEGKQEGSLYPVFTLTRFDSMLEAALFICIVGLARGHGGVHEVLSGGPVVQAEPQARVQKAGDVVTAAGGPHKWVGLHGDVCGHELRWVLATGPTAVPHAIMVHAKRVSDLMGDGECRGQADVLIDATTSFALTHPAHGGQA